MSEEYKFRDDLKHLFITTPIEILTGKYKGVIFAFGKIGLSDSLDQLEFHYSIYKSPFKKHDEEFKEYITGILTNLILSEETTNDLIQEKDDNGRENSNQEFIDE